MNLCYGPAKVLSFACLLCGLGVAAILTAACQGAPSSSKVVMPSQTYEVKGRVRQIEHQGKRTQLIIHHETIPEFVDNDGQIVGMEAMTMPFTVAENVDLGGIGVGSEILFELTVDWSAAEPGLITNLELQSARSETD